MAPASLTLSGKDSTSENAPRVLALGRDVQPVADAYAACSGRQCVYVAHVDDLAKVAQQRPNEVVVLVTSPATLTFRTLGVIEDSFTSPWGLLCARDLPALTFLMAKQLISLVGRVDYASIGVDVLTRTVVRHAQGLTARESYTPDTTRAVANGDWSNLGLLAHGEGSHLNLEEVVCCGATLSTEEHLAGSTISGC